MKKLPPSKRMSKAMRELLEQGTEGYIPREFLRLGKQLSIKGELELLIPQVRQAPEPFIPKVAQFFKGHTDLLDRLVVEMHTRGLSTRDIEDTLVMLTGEKVLSKGSISRVTEALWRECQAFGDVADKLMAMSKESYECWLEFLRDLVSRGLRPPVAVTSDGTPGSIKAIETVFPRSVGLRC